MISALQKQGWRARNRCQWIAFRYESVAKGFLLGFLSGMPLLPYGAYLGIAQQHLAGVSSNWCGATIFREKEPWMALHVFLYSIFISSINNSFLGD